MHTTIDIDDDLIESTRALAELRRVSIDGLISDLLRLEIGHRLPVGEDNPLFERSSTGILRLRKRHGSKPVTTAMVRALMDEEDEEYFR